MAHAIITGLTDRFSSSDARPKAVQAHGGTAAMKEKNNKQAQTITSFARFLKGNEANPLRQGNSSIDR